MTVDNNLKAHQHIISETGDNNVIETSDSSVRDLTKEIETLKSMDREKWLLVAAGVVYGAFAVYCLAWHGFPGVIMCSASAAFFLGGALAKSQSRHTFMVLNSIEESEHTRYTLEDFSTEIKNEIEQARNKIAQLKQKVSNYISTAFA